jgi:hypothetical protein
LRPDLVSLITRSLIRFGQLDCRRATILPNCRLICAKLPLVVFADLVRLSTNGWINKRRFGGSFSRCGLCLAEGAQDEVSRLLVCPIALSLQLIFSPHLGTLQAWRMLCAEAMGARKLLLQALLISILKQVRNQARESNTVDFVFFEFNFEHSEKMFGA